MILLGICIGFALYGALLYGVHLIFTSAESRKAARRAAIAARMRKHVSRGAIWS